MAEPIARPGGVTPLEFAAMVYRGDAYLSDSPSFEHYKLARFAALRRVNDDPTFFYSQTEREIEEEECRLG